MKNADLRAEPRVSVICQGTMSVGDTSAPCVIQNMCSRGFLIRANKALPVGELVRLTCELYPQRRVECLVQVRHVNRECLGAKVIEITEDGKLLCQQFIEEQRAANLKIVA